VQYLQVHTHCQHFHICSKWTLAPTRNAKTQRTHLQKLWASN
jgi:hypothetical protein